MTNGGKHKDVRYPELKETVFVTKEAVLEHGRGAIGKTAGYYDKTGRLAKAGNKGRVGQTIEEGLYGYHINSESEPDFPVAGVEVKTTGVLRDRRQFRAKERLVLNIINYMKEAGTSFETSSFWHKNRLLMLIVYEYLKGRPYVDFPILAAELFTYPIEDLFIIRDDWAKIVGKIRAGKAHELSEGDTLYLGACTKGSAGGNPRPQPFSEIPAKQRAYCLKQSYMTYVIQTHIFHGKTIERIIQDIQAIKEKSFEEYVIERLDEYHGKSVDELKSIFKIESKAKNIESMLAFRILGVKGNRAEELEKAGIVVKAIRIKNDGTIEQNMSFPAFKYMELAEEEWDDSTFGNYLRDTRFLFIVFRFDAEGNKRLLGGQFWNIPYEDLEGNVKKVWLETRDIIRNGKLTIHIRHNRMYNNFPKEQYNSVSHVRPHGKNREDSVNQLPYGTEVNIASSDGSYVWPYKDRFTNYCFWLNNDYVLSQLDERFKR